MSILHDSEPSSEFIWEKFKPMCRTVGAVTVNRALVWDSRDLHPIPGAAHDLKGDSGHDTPVDSVSLSQSIK